MSSHTNYPSLSSTYLETIQKQLGYLSSIMRGRGFGRLWADRYSGE